VSQPLSTVRSYSADLNRSGSDFLHGTGIPSFSIFRSRFTKSRSCRSSSPADKIDALHLSLTAIGGDSRFARFPDRNHPRKVRPAFNIQCCVMVTVCHKTTIDATMFARRQPLTHSLTAVRAILRRVGWIHLDYHTASLFRFAREDQDELIPSRVTDALC
jgi:hypothetical protein